MRRTILGAVTAAVAVGCLAFAPPATAAQHQNAYYYSHWTFAGSSTGYWDVDQDKARQYATKREKLPADYGQVVKALGF